MGTGFLGPRQHRQRWASEDGGAKVQMAKPSMVRVHAVPEMVPNGTEEREHVAEGLAYCLKSKHRIGHQQGAGTPSP